MDSFFCLTTRENLSYTPICPIVHHSIRPVVHPFVHSSIIPTVQLCIHPSIRPSIHSSSCASVHPSIHPWLGNEHQALYPFYPDGVNPFPDSRSRFIGGVYTARFSVRVRFTDKINGHIIAYVPDLFRFQFTLEIGHGRSCNPIHDLVVEDAP